MILIRNERFTLILLIFLALFLRLWNVDRLGLSYDEAATALMSRATLSEIVLFHWTASFEHPPFWILTMHYWSLLFGQSEIAIRLLSILAGVLLVPIFWHFLRYAIDMSTPWRILALLLLVTSPILLEYSRIGRMYSMVVLLAMINLYACWYLFQQVRWLPAVIFVMGSWLMTGYHFYTGLLLATEAGVALLVLLFYKEKRRYGLVLGGLLILAGIPLVLWLFLAPGFQETAEVILIATNRTEQEWFAYLYLLWHELIYSFAESSINQRIVGYLLLASGAIGLVKILAFPLIEPAKHQRYPRHWYPIWPSHLLAVAVLLVPITYSLFQFGSIKVRYVLYILPSIYITVAYGIALLWRMTPVLGVVSICVAGWIQIVGLHHNFTIRQNIEYREMAKTLMHELDEGDGIILHGPRQHLLAKYYLNDVASFPTQSIYPMPQVDLPEHWPVTGPQVVPEEVDGQLQSYLRKHEILWLILSGQSEVDPNEFVEKYLNTVAYEEDCSDWVRVRLCRFHSPSWVTFELTQRIDAQFGEELTLQAVELALTEERTQEDANRERYLLMRFDWWVDAKPAGDYKATLRLLDSQNELIGQRDIFLNGNLILPTTWNPGEQRPGQMVLEIPSGMQPGVYQVVAGLYDPQTLNNIPYQIANGSAKGELLPIVALRINNTNVEILH